MNLASRSALALLALASIARSQPAPAAADDNGGPQPARVTLEEAVRRALARNPSALVADAEIRRAAALVREAEAGWLPTLTGNGTYTRLDGDRVLGGTVILPKDQLNLNALLTVPLVAPRAWVQTWQAQDQREVAKLSAADVRRQLALAVGHAYLAIVTQRRVIDVDTHARDNDRAHYDFAHARYAGGIGSRLDEVRARQQFESDEAQLQSAWAGLARAREALGVLVGVDEPLDVASEPAFAPPGPLPEALRGADTRADVRAAAERKRAAERVLRNSWADYAPYFGGTFSPFFQDPPTSTIPKLGWEAQLILTIPLYDGGLRYGLHRERAALVDEARVQLEGQLRQARADVRAAFEVLRRADEALLASHRASEQARDALALANLAYRTGTISNLDVIDAERRALDAETGSAIAEDAARQARLDLLSASGQFP